MKAGERKRILAVVVVAIVWVVVTVVAAFVNTELMLVAEIGWVIVVAWAVFRLLPLVSRRASLDDVYEQYADQLDKLEQAGVAMPAPSCIEDLVAAIDLVSPSE